MITTAFFDPAARTGKQHDYKAIIVGTLMPSGIYYVRYAFIRRASTDTVLEKAYEVDAEFPGILFGFEANGFQLLYEDLLNFKAKEKGYHLNIIKVTSTGNKEARIESLAGYIERGLIRFRKGYSDIDLLIEQLLDFPHGAHDDGPDALQHAFNLARNHAVRAAYSSTRKSQVRSSRFSGMSIPFSPLKRERRTENL